MQILMCFHGVKFPIARSTAEFRIMYTGRFAPSPTGPLHFGSLIAAVGSYLDAHANQGRWLVRIEDIDPPREQAGAADNILKTLESFGFKWDGPVRYQSQRSESYEQALQQLQQSNTLYPCCCSRRQIALAANSGPYGSIYPGTCRHFKPGQTSKNDPALRVLTTNNKIQFIDLIQGEYSQTLETEIGDYILKRRDGLYGYHLAVAIDDADQKITRIVRGFDLLDSTPRQIYLQQLLMLPTPEYAHLPMAVHPDGSKLSKQTFATALDVTQANHLLWQALNFLNQKPAEELKKTSIETIWQWAGQNWSLPNIKKQPAIPAPAEI